MSVHHNPFHFHRRQCHWPVNTALHCSHNVGALHGPHLVHSQQWLHDNISHINISQYSLFVIQSWKMDIFQNKTKVWVGHYSSIHAQLNNTHFSPVGYDRRNVGHLQRGDSSSHVKVIFWILVSESWNKRVTWPVIQTRYSCKLKEDLKMKLNTDSSIVKQVSFPFLCLS